MPIQYAGDLSTCGRRLSSGRAIGAFDRRSARRQARWSWRRDRCVASNGST